MKTNILTLVITLVVGIILAGSLLAPVVSDAQRTIGPEVTYTNEPRNGYTYDTDTPIEFYMTVGTNNARTYTINDVVLTQTEFSSINVVVSDGGIIMIPMSTDTTAWGWTSADVEGNSVSHQTTAGNSGMLFEDGVIYLLDANKDRTEFGTYTWVIHKVAGNGEYSLITQQFSNQFYISSNADIIAGGYYSSGELDTFYTYKNGEMKVNNTAYTATANLTTTLTEGTTDIYTASNFSINVTDGENTENFVPYWFFVKNTVVGHETSGAGSLIGAIPIMVIVALLMVAVGAIAYRRAD